MNNNNVGLVLEGGGMRGVYTAGVLDAFMDENISFSYVIGVSAGANNGSNFVSNQRGRNKRLFLNWSKDKRFLGFNNFIREGSYFGMNFLFDKLPNELDKFDYETFYNSEVVFKACTTECETGNAVYFEQNDFYPNSFMNKALRASSSLPIISKDVEIGGKRYIDGGLADFIPIDKSIDDGNKYNVIILTRNKGYESHISRSDNIIKKITLMKYPELKDAINIATVKYDNTLKKINKLEKDGYVFVFRPEKKLVVDRYEKNQSKLADLYEQGYNEAITQMNEFKKWIERVNKESITA